MKVFSAIFGVCLGMAVFCDTSAGVVGDTARVAGRRIGQTQTTNNTSGGRMGSSTQGDNLSMRTNVRERIGSQKNSRDSGTTSKNVSGRTTTSSARDSSNTKTRTTTNSITPRATGTIGATTAAARRVARTATPDGKTRTRTIGSNTRTSTTRVAVPKTTSKTTHRIARAATDTSGIRASNYKHCREIFYECMDEFCANKDSNLRRCACSARSSEFDGVKKQLAQAEDKMLDFNQRLLMVNMDKEDVEAINTATVGENAFYERTDTTESKKTLDDIATKLNRTFAEDTSSTGGTSLAAISLSLNTDSVFDTVDSFSGVDTTTKSGTALYNAAMPVCRDMAMEVCTKDEFALATSGYQMLIEQDCNTVSKVYESKLDDAKNKVLEGSALLDMSRLDAHQTRNADDILTCKQKMLNMLTDSTVCGSNMEKCLDLTGHYIDPTTGAAFLTEDLYDLNYLITRPEDGTTWTTANSSNAFLTFLKNKKTYLEPAMEHCQDVADKVWDAFIEDALAQIKLAQTAKIEEVRQSCTTLTLECMENASDSLADFDSRALSIFGIAANYTASEMCKDIQNACSALLDHDGETSTWANTSTSNTWTSGMTEINTTKTYDSIVSSCTQVGRNCIIQACKSMSGNFGLCEDTEFSANRHSILGRSACWNEVVECVGSAGDEALVDIMSVLNKTPTGDHPYSFYDDVYGDANISPIYDLCSDADSVCNGPDIDVVACAKCRIAERIWGNCAKNSYGSGDDQDDPNTILSSGLVTLMSWFGKNTNNEQCVITKCANGRYYWGCDSDENSPADLCLSADQANEVTNDNMYCPTDEEGQTPITIRDSFTNCCCTGPNCAQKKVLLGNADDGLCCDKTLQPQNDPDDNFRFCIPATGVARAYTLLYRTLDNGTMERIICMGDSNTTIEQIDPDSTHPSGLGFRCKNGTLVRIGAKGSYGRSYTKPTDSNAVLNKWRDSNHSMQKCGSAGTNCPKSSFIVY